MSRDPTAKSPTAQEKEVRKVQKAQEGAKAMNEYRNREMATRDRTAKLRAERLAREAADAAAEKKDKR